MRIAFLETTIEEGKGIPNRAVALAGGLASLGHEVTLLAFRRDRPGLPPNVRVLPLRALGRLPLPFRAANTSRPALRSLVNILLQGAIDALAPDVVCVDFPPLDWYAVHGRGRRKYKVAYTYHGVANPMHYEGAAREARIRNREAILRSAAGADLVLAVSHHCATELRASGIHAQVLPNGVDTAAFHPDRGITALRGDAPLLLHIGRYTQHKGALDLLRAFARVHREIPDATLLCFARHESPEYVRRLEAFIKEENLVGRAFLFRDVYGDLVPALYATADLFISGAQDETFGMTFLEAAACGTASVAFNAQSIPEVVVHGVTGLLAPPGDVDALASRAVEILRDAPRRRVLGEAARKHALTFDWNDLSARLDASLRTLVSR